MSVQAMSWVIENSQAKGGTLLTLLMIANYTGADGTGAWPSISRLAKDTRMTERAVQMHIRDLLASGELAVEAGGGRGHANVYSIPAVKGEKISPIEIKGEIFSVNKTAERVKNTAERVKPTSPHPLIDPLIHPPVNNSARESLKKKNPMTDCPDDFCVTAEMVAFATKAGFRGDRAHLEFVTQTFLDDRASKGVRYANWTRGWQTWIRNSIGYGQDLPDSRRIAASNGKVSQRAQDTNDQWNMVERLKQEAKRLKEQGNEPTNLDEVRRNGVHREIGNNSGAPRLLARVPDKNG